MSAVDLLLDEGVLEPVPTLAVDVAAILPVPELTTVHTTRTGYLAARRAGLTARAFGERKLPRDLPQAVVVAGKSRLGTLDACAQAASHLAEGGRLLLAGDNGLGIRATARKVAEACGASPETLACRAHARVECFTPVRRDWLPPSPTVVPLVLGDSEVGLTALPGVFSQDRIDAGTALLMGHLADAPAPLRLVDLCCGIGPLGIAALHRWPDARCLFLDADARAVRSVEANLLDLGLMDRADVAWWDAGEGVEGMEQADLVLLNPPWHDGKAADVALGRRLLQLGSSLLTRGGHLLAVANRKLPYENAAGPGCRVLEQADGYKVLLVSHG